MLALNGGSSSVKLAVYDAQTLVLEFRDQLDKPDSAGIIFDVLADRLKEAPLVGIGHRLVHSGPHLKAHQLITPALLAELDQLRTLDPTHVPAERALIDAACERYPHVPQVACFDTVFHASLPTAAQLLPIPRRYFNAGVRRYGFHGLSYEYLMQELARVAPSEAKGRVILAHLGAGASMASVCAGGPVDTTMAFTPAAGLVMATRPGDLDPGVLTYLLRTESLTAASLDDLINHRSGLLGISETTGDMRELLARRQKDPRADQAVSVFCSQARKWIGALGAGLGGLDTLVFSGGIGANAPEIRAEICESLVFLGVRLDPSQNTRASAVISAGPVTVRVMATDEETMIARHLQSILTTQ